MQVEAENEEKRAQVSLQMREETLKKLRRDSSRNRDADKRKKMEDEAITKVFNKSDSLTELEHDLFPSLSSLICIIRPFLIISFHLLDRRISTNSSHCEG